MEVTTIAIATGAINNFSFRIIMYEVNGDSQLWIVCDARCINHPSMKTLFYWMIT